MKYNILIADADSNSTDQLCRVLSQRSSAGHIDCAFDGDVAYFMANAKYHDILIMDPLLPKRHGLCVLKDLLACKNRPFVIFYAQFLSPSIIESAGALNVQHILYKSNGTRSLLSVFDECVRQLDKSKMSPAEEMDDPRSDIMRMMLDLHFSLKLTGCRYLADAVLLARDTPAMLRNLNDGLYAVIADQWHSSPSCVERCIRNAIHIADRDGNLSRVLGCHATCKSCIQYLVSPKK